MVRRTSYMFVTGPNVVKTVTHEDVTLEELGGADVHSMTSGVAHFAAADEVDCLMQTRRLMSFLPANNLEDPPQVSSLDPADRAEIKLNTVIPDQPTRSYDMHAVIRGVVDEGDF